MNTLIGNIKTELNDLVRSLSFQPSESSISARDKMSLNSKEESMELTKFAETPSFENKIGVDSGPISKMSHDFLLCNF